MGLRPNAVPVGVLPGYGKDDACTWIRLRVGEHRFMKGNGISAFYHLPHLIAVYCRGGDAKKSDWNEHKHNPEAMNGPREQNKNNCHGGENNTACKGSFLAYGIIERTAQAFFIFFCVSQGKAPF